jgi:hypothetical protein
MTDSDLYEVVVYIPASAEATNTYLTAKLVEKGYLTAEIVDCELGETQADGKRPVKIFFTKELDN